LNHGEGNQLYEDDTLIYDLQGGYLGDQQFSRSIPAFSRPPLKLRGLILRTSVLLLEPTIRRPVMSDRMTLTTWCCMDDLG
jgi:hypothetical protein